MLDDEFQSVTELVILMLVRAISHRRKQWPKFYKVDFYWPTMFKDVHSFCVACDRCQRLGSLTRKHMMPLNPILIIEVFDCWGIDFIG